MTVKEFIGAFSHNNEMFVENKNNYRMRFYFNEFDASCFDKIMDWYLPHTDIANCEVICIKQVHDDGKFEAITLKVNTDLESFIALKEETTQLNSPLWFYEKVYGLAPKSPIKIN